MLDLYGLPSATSADVQTFIGNSVAAGVTWQPWLKPRGKTMAFIKLLGHGGNGGTGVIGVNSTAAGGGGGGSGAMSALLIPIFFLPDILYISLPGPGSVTLQAYVAINPDTVNNHIVLQASPGGAGGNAAGATGGSAGSAGSINTLTQGPIGGCGVPFFLAGQVGIIGGAAVSGGALTLPVTGLIITGGTGGGGLPAAAATGTNGGSFTVPAAPSPFPPQIGGIGNATATVPAQSGSSGFGAFRGQTFFYGGTGAASTHGTATGGGLVQGNGGNGGVGCGGGGMGGALTGSTAGTIGKGGPAWCQIICW